MKTFYVDGQFVSEDKAVIPVTDLSVLRGYGVCDIMRTFRGKPYFFGEHIKRLEKSAKEIGLTLPWSQNDIIKIVIQTLKKNPGIDQVNIRIIITGGSSTDFFTPQGNPRLIVLITDLKKLPDSWYTNGVNVVTFTQERPMPDAKITSYIPASLALKKAKKKNAVEAIYINRQKEVLEGTTSNLFAFFNNTLVTPATGVLKGITRQAILLLAREQFTIEERPIRLKDILCADEVFISGTSKGIVPVVKIDDHPIGDQRPGKNTKILMTQLEDHAEQFIQDAKTLL